MNIKLAAALLAAGLGLSGCATTETFQDDSTGAVSCCASYAELATRALPEEGLSLEIRSSDPFFDFATGRSRFAVLQLPAKLPGSGKMLVIPTGRGVAVGMDISLSQAYFHPALTFLDADKKVLSTFLQDVLTGPVPGCDKDIPCGVTLIQADIPANARFVAIHSPSHMVGRQREQLLGGNNPGIAVMVSGIYVPIPGGPRKVRAIGTTTGTLEVRLF